MKITNLMFSEVHGITVVELSVTLNMSIVPTGAVHLEYKFSEPLKESITLTSVSLSQFETYWEIIPDGCVLLKLTP